MLGGYGQISVRKILKTPHVLVQPDTVLPFQVQMDASDVGLGAILIHQTSEDKKVISYVSWGLQGAKHQTQKECLVVVWDMEKCWHYLKGVKFEIYTERGAFGYPQTSPQQARQTLKLQQFNFDIHYHKECMDIVLDALFWAVEPEQAPVLAS